MGLQGALEGQRVLVLVAVVEGQRHHRGGWLDLDLLRLHRLGVAGQVGGEKLDGCGARQLERACVDRAGGGRRRAVGRVVGLVDAPATGVVGRGERHGDRSVVGRGGAGAGVDKTYYTTDGSTPTTSSTVNAG